MTNPTNKVTELPRYNCGNGEGMFLDKQGNWIDYNDAEKALAYERWKAQMFDKWKSLNRWKYNSGNDGYDHFDVFALNYREHKTFDELYNSEEYAQYLQTLKQLTQ